MQAVVRYISSYNQPAPRMTIVITKGSVTITTDGRAQKLVPDGNGVVERAENGLVKLSRTSRWDKAALVSEIEIDSGQKVSRRYEVSPGGTELRVTTTIAGDRALFVYERPLE